MSGVLYRKVREKVLAGVKGLLKKKIREKAWAEVRKLLRSGIVFMLLKKQAQSL